MSPEFVGSKSLEWGIYGLTVFTCKEISHPFTHIVNKFYFLIWKDHKRNSPRSENTSRIMFLFSPFETRLSRKSEPGALRVEQGNQNSHARFHFI